jgi:hypothetical protein
MSVNNGSLLARKYSGICDRRLRQFVSFSDRQNEFTNLDGCKTNIDRLGKALSYIRADSVGMIIIVHIAKAIETIPHAALKETNKGVSVWAASLLGLLYNDCWTTIMMGSSNSSKNQLKRGVNQGNPLSPLLFNVILDPIIEAIDSDTTGIDMARENVSILSFANDIVLISKNTTTAHEQLTMFSSYLTLHGMNLATRKCSTLQMKISYKT